MDNLLSGALGGLIGTIISAFFSYLIFFRQIRLDNNRHFLLKLIEVIQEIYVAQISNKLVSQEKIDFLNSFQAIAFGNFEKVGKLVNELKDIIVQYNEGREKSMSSTTISQSEINAKSKLAEKITEIAKYIRKVT